MMRQQGHMNHVRSYEVMLHCKDWVRACSKDRVKTAASPVSVGLVGVRLIGPTGSDFRRRTFSRVLK